MLIVDVLPPEWPEIWQEIRALQVPNCGRCCLRSVGRSDRKYSSDRCRMRQLRAGPGGDVK